MDVRAFCGTLTGSFVCSRILPYIPIASGHIKVSTVPGFSEIGERDVYEGI